jgi:hypothetical protein
MEKIIKFKIERNLKAVDGKVIYIKREHSFIVKPFRNTDISIFIKDLGIDIESIGMRALGVGGYHPDGGSWIRKELNPPRAEEGALILEADIEPGRGDFRLPESLEFKTYYDEKSGWVCIGNCEKSKDSQTVEFLKNCIAVLEDGNLIALWLKPVFV